MIIGNKSRFALEYEIREYYESDFVGDGKFLVHIGNASFGQDRIDSTTFSGIIPRLGQRAEKYVVSDAEFHDVDEEVFARRFYQFGYTDTDLESIDKRQVAAFQSAVSRNNIAWSAMDEAFDDGTFVLQINRPGEDVVLIGFRSSLYSPGVVMEIKSMRVTFSEYKEVVFGFIDALKTDFEKEFGHGGEMAVFNWWKGIGA